MDQEFSTLVETAKRLALLAETLERRSEATVQEHKQAVSALEEAIYQIRHDVDQVVSNAGSRVSQLVQEGMDSAMTEGTAKYDQAITAASSKLGSASKAMAESQETAAAHVRRLIWLAYAAVGGVLVLLLLGGGLLTWFQWQQYHEVRERAAAVRIQAEVLEAYSRVGITSCGGRPCVKLDTQSPHWGRDGEYVLLDTNTGDKKSAPPKN
ncbi:hypothetical protein [Luteimonas panaciterrae]|uniref:hypothetical protein n=1 Tax=Luteimonas panaciterrae TaxID=363885 RepID=UPI001CFB3C97|nr:hypothetical protein [Luteimonas panaciterrae]